MARRERRRDPKRTMTFANGEAVFNAKYARQVTYPLGPTRDVLIVEGQHTRSVKDVMPEVQFDNHLYRTYDPQIAGGLIRDMNNFDQPWGWSLDPDCITGPAGMLFSHFDTEDRAEIALALVEGMDADAVLGEIDPDAVEAAKVHASEPTPISVQIECPVAGCEATTGIDQISRKLMAQHVRAMHPDYDPKDGKIVSQEGDTATLPTIAEGVQTDGKTEVDVPGEGQ